MNYEQQFLDALKSIFVGAKVEGESGYINLMKIKANYFEKGVFPQLMKDIETACKPFEKGFREELFDKLYDFFQHYFSESGSIYFRNTAQHHNIYEKVYTDDRDVMLFWKTHMLYYVKTDRLFNSMDVEVDGETFYFDVSGMELKRANEKRELTYTFKSFRDGKTTLTVGYSEKGRRTKLDDILKAVKARGVTLSEETLEKAFRVFEKQSEVDYFINKNAKAFLREQFDLWMYQYLFKGESDFKEERLRQLQAIKEIAYKIIDFIAQFEDELVRVWNKPKFVLNSSYIITLDHVVASGAKLSLTGNVIESEAKQSPVKRKKAARQDSSDPEETLASEAGAGVAAGKDTPRSDILERLFKHRGMKDQIAEWQELGMLHNLAQEGLSNPDPASLLEMVLETDLVGEPLHPQYQYLPLDTKYFKDLEPDILALFDDLDDALDGWLVHSENYQALNTLLPKFREQVKAVYIDPPYNTGGDDFIYKDKFRHASWLAMIENRLRIARQLLNSSGIIFINIDENEQPSLRLLMEEVFEPENYVVPFIWTSRAGKSLTASMFQIAHEHIESAAKDKTKITIKSMRKVIEGGRFKDEKGEYNRELLRQWGGQHDRREDRPNLYYPIPTPFGVDAYPKRPDGSDGNWRCSKENAMKMLNDNDLDFVRNETTGEITVYRKIRAGQVTFSVPSNMLNDVGTSTDGTKSLLALFGDKIFGTAKPPQLIQRMVEFVSWQDTEKDIVLDFFGGSGTTAHAVMNLNRTDGGKRKYILVEMGEHFNTVILPRIKKVAFSDKWKDGKAQEGKGISHFVKYFELEQYEDTLRKARYKDAPLFAGTQEAYTSYVFLRDLKLLDAVKVDKKKNRVEVSLEKLYDGIDLAETLSCLTGKWIKRITQDTVEFQDGTTASLSDPNWEDVKPLIWW